MLRRRILTALILAPVFLGAPFVLSSGWLAVLFGVVIALGAREWAELAGLSCGMPRGVYVVALMALGTLGVAAAVAAPHSPLWPYALLPALAWWAWALIEMIRDRSDGLYHSTVGKAVSGFFVLVPVWVCTVLLHAADVQRPWVLLYLLLLVWAADTFAYFAGHMFGRHKLAPTVSPGKTVEGVAGGVAAVAAITWLCGTMVFNWQDWRLAAGLALAVTVTLVSVLGDLVESKFKRVAGVKDSGAILPGHGGILDRIDALSAAAPLFTFGWLQLLRTQA
jgi:phosphatidate cytidylyltransferase